MVTENLGISENEAEKMLSPTGSAGARHGTVLDDGRVMVTGASEHHYELDRACHACAETMASAMARAAQRRDAAADAAAEATAAASVQEQSPFMTCVRAATAAVARAAPASVKAEAAALQAAAEVRRSLQKQEQAAAAAEDAHQRYCTCREFLQQEAAAMESCVIQYAHQDMITLPNGIKGFDCDDPPFVGDFDRFFVKLFVDGSPGGYMLCLTHCNDRDTIASVKAKLQDKEGIPAERLYLIWKGQKLSNERTLSSYGIVDNDTDWQIYGLLIPETVPLPTPTVPSGPETVPLPTPTVPSSSCSIVASSS